MPEMKSPGGGRQSLARASVSQALGRAGAYSTTPQGASTLPRIEAPPSVSGVGEEDAGALYFMMVSAWGGYDWRSLEPSKPAAAQRAAARTLIAAIDGGRPTRVWLKPVERYDSGYTDARHLQTARGRKLVPMPNDMVAGRYHLRQPAISRRNPLCPPNVGRHDRHGRYRRYNQNGIAVRHRHRDKVEL